MQDGRLWSAMFSIKRGRAPLQEDVRPRSSSAWMGAASTEGPQASDLPRRRRQTPRRNRGKINVQIRRVHTVVMPGGEEWSLLLIIVREQQLDMWKAGA